MSATRTDVKLRELLLVGSVPLATVEDVFRATGATIGPWLSSVPDGEVGERLDWTGFLPEHVFANCDQLERVSKPDYNTQEQPPDHEHHWSASRIDLSQVNSFRIRDGADEVVFADLYAGGVAIESYRTFVRLREEGVLPAHLRFQVCLPGTTSAIDEHFSDPADWPCVKDAYRVAIAAEIQRILEVVPAEDLTIQFDLAWEIVDLSIGDEPMFPWSPQRSVDEKLAVHIEGLRVLAETVPEDVVVGVHWCYGTWGGWPMNEMSDLDLCAEMTVAALAACSRRIDYVHMPVSQEAGEEFFAPLAALADADCKVYLGLLHTEDGLAGFQRRWGLASAVLPGAGVAAVCGFGRLGREIVPGALELHRLAAETVTPRASRGSSSEPTEDIDG